MLDVVVKDIAADLGPAPNDPDSPHGTFEVILSAPVVDRDGETLHPDEWQQPLPDHITFDIDHGMSVACTVGSGTPVLDDNGNLRVRGSYASTELAQTTRALVTEGHIRATSVAFLRRQDRKAGTVRRELLNGAFVAVPANPAAVVLSSKTLTPDRPDQHVALGLSKTQREQLAHLDVNALPEVVRAVLTALGLIDPADPEPNPSDPTDEPAGEPADQADEHTALALRARRLRAMTALITNP